MVLPVSGQLTASAINLEMQRSSNATFNINGSDERKLAQKTTTGSQIAFSDFYGKAWIFLTTFEPFDVAGYGTVTGESNFVSDGTWATSGGVYSGNWTPTSTNIGTNYWIRFTETSESGSGGTWTIPSGWLQLNTTRTISASKSSIGRHQKTFTIEIAGGSGGTPVLASVTDSVFAVERL